MGLFVDTTGVSVDIDELGVSLTHPTTDFDFSSKFTAREIAEAESLTLAIASGQLAWKKSAGGSILSPGDYDPDIVIADEANLGTGDMDDRVVTFKDLTGDNITGASPGFSFARAGSVQNAWLKIEGGVPSNKVGRPIMLDNGKIRVVSMYGDGIDTFDVEIYEHDQSTFTLLHTTSVVSAVGIVDDGLSIPVTKGKQLAAKINNTGSAQNPACTVVIRGDT